MSKKPTMLLIMDGFGLAPAGEENAISCASTPRLDELFARYPHTQLQASGLAVGLPEGQMGNSEVGHTNIGAGRVVYQDLPRISNAVADGSFFENPAYKDAMAQCVKNGTRLHLAGLLSDGGVHSHITHLFALLEMARREGVKEVYVHALLDGRDVGPATGAGYVRALADEIARLGVGSIATVQGRFYGMDRDKRWDRVEKGYAAMVYGEGVSAGDPVAAVEESYRNGVTDEFVVPTVCDKNGVIRSGDSVIFINFRPDRAREITRALVDPAFDGFERRFGCFPLHYVCTTEYDATIPNVSVAFPAEEIEMTFGEYLGKLGKRQLRIAETEKYAHVTFFFNGGVEAPYPGEDRCLIPSPKQFPTYDLIPEMSARPVTDECVKRILSGEYDVVICNLANCDMVGHTGVKAAAVKAVETVDECVGRMTDAVLEMGGVILITADHGNADRIMKPDGSPDTAHTTNPVPLIVAGAGELQLKSGRLCDLCPTMLELMGIPQPAEMTGESLIVK
ncbi:MAG: 2,3-bisphosphoglycerate-independent phosphoglycerate mutase [Oscillospiraceae bacterium]|nr:2,3-bisphosphoglycerate-independent phosphoglycerate mutase [Oscillospiraceae bacterium]